MRQLAPGFARLDASAGRGAGVGVDDVSEAQRGGGCAFALDK
jgi:hypothetical protein